MKLSKKWTSGKPLTDAERKMLLPVIDKAMEIGRTPTKREIEGVASLKLHFGTWNNVIEAAGLPSLKEPQQVWLRENSLGR